MRVVTCPQWLFPCSPFWLKWRDDSYSPVSVSWTSWCLLLTVKYLEKRKYLGLCRHKIHHWVFSFTFFSCTQQGVNYRVSQKKSKQGPKKRIIFSFCWLDPSKGSISAFNKIYHVPPWPNVVLDAEHVRWIRHSWPLTSWKLKIRYAWQTVTRSVQRSV